MNASNAGYVRRRALTYLFKKQGKKPVSSSAISGEIPGVVKLGRFCGRVWKKPRNRALCRLSTSKKKRLGENNENIIPDRQNHWDSD
jgi:hypothetical protein